MKANDPPRISFCKSNTALILIFFVKMQSSILGHLFAFHPDSSVFPSFCKKSTNLHTTGREKNIGYIVIIMIITFIM